MKNYDVIIIGAGLVGLATGYKILQQNPSIKLAILEKEANVAQHQSGRNSGVIHSGIYYKPQSLKAINCQKGYRQLIEFCQKFKISYEICGKIIAATSVAEFSMLEQIHQRGIAHGLSGLKKITKEAALEIEPHLECLEALWVPQTGIVDFPAVAQKLAMLITAMGGSIYLNCKVENLKYAALEKFSWIIINDEQEMRATQLINCAGIYADKISALSEQKSDSQIVPFRGEYYKLKKEKEYLVKNLIYPVPNPNFPFLGVHFTRMIHGGIEAGPNAVLAFKREGYDRWDFDAKELWEVLRFGGFHKLAAKNWVEGIIEMKRSYFKKSFVAALQQLIPSLTMNDVEPDRSGVRAMSLSMDGSVIDDFLFLNNASKKIVNVINAPSPAATACLSIGEYIAAQINI